MTEPGARLLIVGGYGTFGGRLVDLLRDEPRLTLLVAGRSGRRAEAFCADRPAARARLQPAVFDRTGDLGMQLRALAPDLLVDASGPFQQYGAAGYRLLEACLAARIHYLDLADGSDFVAGVSVHDAAARAAGVFVLSGVSSFPVLTAAVVRHLSDGLTRITAIRGGIAPSPFAGVGENVIRAIAGYAGQPIALRRNGRTAVGRPFTEQRRYTVAPPGGVPLRNLLFSLVDVPDLRALATLWPDAQDIWMGAGPVPEALHRVLIGLSWLVRGHLLPSLSWLSRLMYLVMNRLRWGEHRGGMFVTVEGLDAHAHPVTRSWHLVADGDDGPLIPSMAIEALVRRTLDGQPPAAGARPATQELELADYARLFANRRIRIGSRDDTPASMPLFTQLLGAAFARLPDALRAVHGSVTARVARGRCRIERGHHFLSRLVATLAGFPRAGNDVPVAVQFSAHDGGERWTRQFGGQVLSSELRAGRGRSERLLVEHIGLLAFAQALVVDGERLRFELRRWHVLGVALPLWLAPRSHSYETQRDGRFEFHVEISHPWLGLIVRYQGWLAPEDSSLDDDARSSMKTVVALNATP